MNYWIKKMNRKTRINQLDLITGRKKTWNSDHFGATASSELG